MAEIGEDIGTGSFISFFSKEKGFIDEVLKDGEKFADSGFYRLPHVTCSRFVKSGMENLINLNNTCEQHKMATVAHSGYPTVLKYRLPGKSARLIRTYGVNSVILQDENWDFNYGEDVADKVEINREDIGSQRLFSLSNGTRYYVCFKGLIMENGSLLPGYSFGIIEPRATVRVYASLIPNQPVYFLQSARADPL